MKILARLCLVTLCLGLIFSLPATAKDIDWDQVKQTWNTLTAEEQDAYRALMPSNAERNGTATILGRQAAPTNLVPGDTCGASTPEVSALPFADAGSTVGLTDDYDIDGIGGVCDTTFNSTGLDIVYSVEVDQTCDVTALHDGDYDEVLYIVTDCSDLAGSCIGSEDNGGVGEQVSFTATAGTEYFVIVDGWNGGNGSYTLTVTEDTATGCMLVPVELQSFSID